MTTAERLIAETVERCARVCEATCGNWCAPSTYEKRKNPETTNYCPCAKAIRSLSASFNCEMDALPSGCFFPDCACIAKAQSKQSAAGQTGLVTEPSQEDSGGETQASAPPAPLT